MQTKFINGIECIMLENDNLSATVVPAMGGKLISLFNKVLDKEFLWRNTGVPFEVLQRGADYDTNFFGGIDELLPNDLPETFDGITYPDHGELWTAPLDCVQDGATAVLSGRLSLSGLHYEKRITLDASSPIVRMDYRIVNGSGRLRHFLWKLHAALHIAKGDMLITDAAKAAVVNRDFTRFPDADQPFAWPHTQGVNAAVVPGKNGTMDFFYLYGAKRGEMKLVSEDTVFAYRYDPDTFPFQWYFASYGGFLGHYVAILEPCTNVPISVPDAIRANTSAVLQPGSELTTTVQIFAGHRKAYMS